MNLYITGTPIGNLEDMTFRAINTLKTVDAILCEDTRNTRKLTAHFDIHTPLVAYHDHNKSVVEDKIIEEMRMGRTFALVSDAGMPLISDPGFELVRRMQESGLTYSVVPGPSAYISAVVASGIPSYEFTFFGFLPKNKKKKKDKLDEIMTHSLTSVLYESPHKIKETLKFIADIDGAREISISREITKKFEQHVRHSASEIFAMIGESIPLKGEFVIVISGNEATETAVFDTTEVEDVDELIGEGFKPNAAIKKVAESRGIKRQDVYDMYHKNKKDG